MNTYRKFIGLLPDNDEAYLTLLEAVIGSVDEFSTLIVIKNPMDFQIKISPSVTGYIPIIIQEINKLNNLCGIRVEFSKSMKNSASVDFSIKI